jgi:hypothetical protein
MSIGVGAAVGVKGGEGKLMNRWRLAAMSMVRTNRIEGGKEGDASVACISDIIVSSASKLASADFFLCPVTTTVSASAKADALNMWSFAHDALALAPYFSPSGPASVTP